MSSVRKFFQSNFSIRDIMWGMALVGALLMWRNDAKRLKQSATSLDVCQDTLENVNLNLAYQEHRADRLLRLLNVTNPQAIDPTLGTVPADEPFWKVDLTAGTSSSYQEDGWDAQGDAGGPR